MTFDPEAYWSELDQALDRQARTSISQPTVPAPDLNRCGDPDWCRRVHPGWRGVSVPELLAGDGPYPARSDPVPWPLYAP